MPSAVFTITLRELLVSLWQDSLRFRALVCVVLVAAVGLIACMAVGSW